VAATIHLQGFRGCYQRWAKLLLKSNGDEALNEEFLLKSNGDEALKDVSP
jgi:hypothetical protein